MTWRQAAAEIHLLICVDSFFQLWLSLTVVCVITGDKIRFREARSQSLKEDDAVARESGVACLLLLPGQLFLLNACIIHTESDELHTCSQKATRRKVLFLQCAEHNKYRISSISIVG